KWCPAGKATYGRSTGADAATNRDNSLLASWRSLRLGVLGDSKLKRSGGEDVRLDELPRVRLGAFPAPARPGGGLSAGGLGGRSVGGGSEGRRSGSSATI